MSMLRRIGAEFFGTFWLVLGGCGSAVLAAAFPGLGIGFVGVALAFGLTVLTMAYAVGHISGCHLNPAVSVGLWIGGRFPAKDLVPYVLAQVAGGIAGAGVLYAIATGAPNFNVSAGFATNGYGLHSPGGYSHDGGPRLRDRDDGDVPPRDPGSDRQARAEGFRSYRDRARPHAHPLDLDPSHEHIGQPGAQYGRGDLPGRLGAPTALALLGGPHRRRARRRHSLSPDRWPEVRSGVGCPVPQYCPESATPEVGEKEEGPRGQDHQGTLN